MFSYREVQRLSKRGNVIPLFDRISADLDTPVTAFVKLAGYRKEAFLLESIEGGEKLARYSFLGCDPFLTVEADGNGVLVRRGRHRRRFPSAPIDFVRELFRVYRPVAVSGLPRFTGGAVGHFSYDVIRWIENIPDSNPDEIGLPLMRLALFRNLVVFDHLKQEILVVANILHDRTDKGLKAKYDSASQDVTGMIRRLRQSRMNIRPESTRAMPIRSHMSAEDFRRMVTRTKRYIREGDIFQGVLSRRWSAKAEIDPLTLYRRLRRLNPSPYMFLLRFGSNAIIGSSPEMLVRIENRRIETRPIAGTRPRGRNEREDERLIQELLADPKELAEHTMLLDLGRNDLGRVCSPGSVTVDDQMIVEKYSHVIHLVSSVSGRLRRGVSPLEGLMACFPAGTVSGAPKIRAMEIIDELESERRGVYAGAVGYLDFWGNLDSCIAIRTIVKRGDRYYVQAGAGIVADSKPMREYRETEAKAMALLAAITGRKV